MVSQNVQCQVKLVVEAFDINLLKKSNAAATTMRYQNFASPYLIRVGAASQLRLRLVCGFSLVLSFGAGAWPLQH